MNTLDKLKSYVSSKAGLDISRNRAQANFFNENDYDITKETPSFNIGFETTVEDDIIALETARNTSRLKTKNNGFFKGLLNCATDHVIGIGLIAKSTIPRRKLDTLLEKDIKQIEDDIDNYFNDWCNSEHSDVTGVNNFYMQQRLAYFSYKRDGDCFASLPIINGNISLKLVGPEYLEGDIDGFTHGIKTNPNNKPISYRVRQKNDTYKIISNSRLKTNILHLFKRERADALRGMPFLTEVITDIEYIDNYMKTELKAARLAAVFFGSIQTQSRESVMDNLGKDLSLSSNHNSNVETTKNKFSENQITQLRPDETLNIHQQGRDNPNFDKTVHTTLQKIATCVRMPTEIIQTIFTSSYSASRASLLLMEKFINPERMIFNKQFNNEIRRAVILWGVLKGDLIIPNFLENIETFLKCEWTGETAGSVDPIKDAKAKILLIDNNLTTRTKVTKDLGQGGFEVNIHQLEKEQEMLKNLNEIKRKEEANDNN